MHRFLFICLSIYFKQVRMLALATKGATEGVSRGVCGGRRTREEREGDADVVQAELRGLAGRVAALVACSRPRPAAAVGAKVHPPQGESAVLPYRLAPVLHVHHARACTESWGVMAANFRGDTPGNADPWEGL